MLVTFSASDTFQSLQNDQYFLSGVLIRSWLGDRHLYMDLPAFYNNTYHVSQYVKQFLMI